MTDALGPEETLGRSNRPAAWMVHSGAGLRVHRAHSQHVYARALQLVECCGLEIAQGGVAPLRDLRRALHVMIDIMEEDDSALVGLASVKGAGPHYVLTHAVNVAVFSLALARAAGLSRVDRAAVGMAALLHDVGQVEVPPGVLEREGPLSRHEWLEMQRHTLAGTSLLLRAGSLEGVAHAALTCLEHHMHGTRSSMAGSHGTAEALRHTYPSSVLDEEPAPTSRIVQIADAYDALTSRRPFRAQPVSPDRVVNFFVLHAGEWFDRALVMTFVEVLGIYPPGTVVALDTGEIGVVVKANRNPHFLSRPVVRLLKDAHGAPVGTPPALSPLEVDLSEMRPASRSFLRSVQQCLDPARLGIVPASLFLAEPVASES